MARQWQDYGWLWNLDSHQITVLLLEIQKRWKNRAQCALCSDSVHCEYLYCQKECTRMFTKSKFTPSHQKLPLFLEKQKSWKNSAKCSLCKMCTVCNLIAKKYSILRLSAQSVMLLSTLRDPMQVRWRQCATKVWILKEFSSEKCNSE